MLRKIWVPASLMIMAVGWVGCTPAGNQTAEDVSSVRPTDLPGPPSSAGSGGSSNAGMQNRGMGSQSGPPSGAGGDNGYNNGLPGDPMSAGSGGGGNQSGNNTGGEGNAAVSLPGGSDSAGSDGGGNSGLPGDPMSAGSGGGGNTNSGGGGTNAAVSLPGGPSSAGSGNGGDNSGLPGNPASAGSGGGGGTNATATVGDGPVSGGGQSGPPPGANYGGQSGPPPGANYGGQSGPPQGAGGRSGPPPGSNYGGQSGPPPGANYGGQSGPPQGAGGRSGPPPGSNYGGQSGPPPGANYGGQSGPPQGAGGRSGPPPGSNYGGQSGPPPGANYGGQSGPPQGAGGTGIAGPSSAGSGGGQQGGSDSSASASIPGGGQATGGQSTGGSGGASMSLDGGDWAPPGAGNFPGAGQRPGQQGPQAPAKVEEKSFYDMAMNAFAGGRDVDGYRYLQAEFAANRARFDEMPLSFLPAQKGTTLGLRMGIGIQYTAGQGVTGKAPVIGDAPPSNAGGRGNNFGPGASSGFGPGSGGPGGGGSGVPRDAKGMLEYYGGDLSKSLLAKLEERFRGSPPTYGSIWPQLNLKVLMVEQDGNSSFVSNQNSGGGGFGLPGGPSASGSSGGSFAGYGGQANAGPPEGLYPGLVFLGEANYAELLSRAKKERLDGLFIVDQRANMVPRTGQLTSQTEVKFYVVAEGKERASTSSLNYAMVSQKRSGLSDNSKDPVEKELASVFNKVDRMFVATPMPELTEELATGRLKSIMATAKEEPLPFVAEVNFYIQKGWLNEEDGQNMIIEALGEAAALTLWSGDFAKQKEALKRWLPREAS